LQIGAFLGWIAGGNGQVEIKHKRYLDLRFYRETHGDKGRTGDSEPCGILVTTARACITTSPNLMFSLAPLDAASRIYMPGNLG
jgi:hypothetical protein